MAVARDAVVVVLTGVMFDSIASEVSVKVM